MKKQKMYRKEGLPTIILLITLLVAGGSVLAACGTNDAVKSVTITQPTRTFTVGVHPRLEMRAKSADVSIHAGNEGKIVVNTKMSATGIDVGSNLDPNALKIDYAQTGDTVTVNVAEINSNVIAASKTFTIDIAVPRTGAIEVSATSGNVAIQGLNGPVTIDGNNGDVLVKNATGQMTLSTGSGEIKLEQVKMQGRSQVKTSNGDITFNGSIDPQGSYLVQTSSGDINMSLPSSASFHLKVQTKTGEIKNEFNGDSVGKEPRPLLEMQSNNGDIVLKKG